MAETKEIDERITACLKFSLPLLLFLVVSRQSLAEPPVNIRFVQTTYFATMHPSYHRPLDEAKQSWESYLRSGTEETANVWIGVTASFLKDRHHAEAGTAPHDIPFNKLTSLPARYRDFRPSSPRAILRCPASVLAGMFPPPLLGGDDWTFTYEGFEEVGPIHGTLAFNLNCTAARLGWQYFGIDGMPGKFEQCVMSTAFHEIGHALGFVSTLDAGVSPLLIRDYTPFDVFIGCYPNGGNGGGWYPVEPPYPILHMSYAPLSYSSSDLLVWGGGSGVSAYRQISVNAQAYPPIVRGNDGQGYAHFSFDQVDAANETMQYGDKYGTSRMSAMLASGCLSDTGWRLRSMIARLINAGGIFVPATSQKTNVLEEIGRLQITTSVDGLLPPIFRVLGEASAYTRLEWDTQPSTASPMPPFKPYELRVLLTETPAVGVHQIPILVQYVANGVTSSVIRRVRCYVTEEDRDGDGISDADELCPSGSADCGTWPFDPDVRDSNNNGVDDGYDDPDDDSLSNGLEFLLGTDPFVPTWDVEIDETDDAAQVIEISNQGNWPVELNDAFLDGEDADRYLLEGVPAVRTLAPGKSVKLRVYYVSVDNQLHDDAHVQINYTTANRERSKSIALSGKHPVGTLIL